MKAQEIFEYLRDNVRLVGKASYGGNYDTESPNIVIELWAKNPETDKEEVIASEYISL